MMTRICKYAEDIGFCGEIYECVAYYKNILHCEFCHLDLNPDGSVNIAECKKHSQDQIQKEDNK